jgi:hypothetical protein
MVREALINVKEITILPEQKDKFDRCRKQAKAEKHNADNITSPLYLAEHDGKYIVLDGLWRLAIYMNSQVKEVPCNVSEEPHKPQS